MKIKCAAGTDGLGEKKPRMKWTWKLRSTFAEAVASLGGVELATPKTVLRAMGTQGLSLWQVKSFLQKYRALHTKKLLGGSSPKVLSRASPPLCSPPEEGEEEEILPLPVICDKSSDIEVLDSMKSGEGLKSIDEVEAVKKAAAQAPELQSALQMQIRAMKDVQSLLQEQQQMQTEIEVQHKKLMRMLELQQAAEGKTSGSPVSLAPDMQLTAGGSTFPEVLVPTSLQLAEDLSVDEYLSFKPTGSGTFPSPFGISTSPSMPTSMFASSSLTTPSLTTQDAPPLRPLEQSGGQGPQTEEGRRHSQGELYLGTKTNALSALATSDFQHNSFASLCGPLPPPSPRGDEWAQGSLPRVAAEKGLLGGPSRRKPMIGAEADASSSCTVGTQVSGASEVNAHADGDLQRRTMLLEQLLLLAKQSQQQRLIQQGSAHVEQQHESQELGRLTGRPLDEELQARNESNLSLLGTCLEGLPPATHAPSETMGLSFGQQLSQVVAQGGQQERDTTLSDTHDMHNLLGAEPISSSTTGLPASTAPGPNVLSENLSAPLEWPPITTLDPSLPNPHSSDPCALSFLDVPQELLLGATLGPNGLNSIPARLLSGVEAEQRQERAQEQGHLDWQQEVQNELPTAVRSQRVLLKRRIFPNDEGLHVDVPLIRHGTPPPNVPAQQDNQRLSPSKRRLRFVSQPSSLGSFAHQPQVWPSLPHQLQQQQVQSPQQVPFYRGVSFSSSGGTSPLMPSLLPSPCGTSPSPRPLSTNAALSSAELLARLDLATPRLPASRALTSPHLILPESLPPLLSATNQQGLPPGRLSEQGSLWPSPGLIEEQLRQLDEVQRKIREVSARDWKRSFSVPAGPCPQLQQQSEGQRNNSICLLSQAREGSRSQGGQGLAAQQRGSCAEDRGQGADQEGCPGRKAAEKGLAGQTWLKSNGTGAGGTLEGRLAQVPRGGPMTAKGFSNTSLHHLASAQQQPPPQQQPRHQQQQQQQQPGQQQPQHLLDGCSGGHLAPAGFPVSLAPSPPPAVRMRTGLLDDLLPISLTSPSFPTSQELLPYCYSRRKDLVGEVEGSVARSKCLEEKLLPVATLTPTPMPTPTPTPMTLPTSNGPISQAFEKQHLCTELRAPSAFLPATQSPLLNAPHFVSPGGTPLDHSFSSFCPSPTKELSISSSARLPDSLALADAEALPDCFFPLDCVVPFPALSWLLESEAPALGELESNRLALLGTSAEAEEVSGRVEVLSNRNLGYPSGKSCGVAAGSEVSGQPGRGVYEMGFGAGGVRGGASVGSAGVLGRGADGQEVVNGDGPSSIAADAAVNEDWGGGAATRNMGDCRPAGGASRGQMEGGGDESLGLWNDGGNELAAEGSRFWAQGAASPSSSAGSVAGKEGASVSGMGGHVARMEVASRKITCDEGQQVELQGQQQQQRQDERETFEGLQLHPDIGGNEFAQLLQNQVWGEGQQQQLGVQQEGQQHRHQQQTQRQPQQQQLQYQHQQQQSPVQEHPQVQAHDKQQDLPEQQEGAPSLLDAPSSSLDPPDDPSSLGSLANALTFLNQQCQQVLLMANSLPSHS
eukprot:TRINITY_DN860_c0_g1_i6.p1 TRINITY_DN860_c0_g1~~TRINITY_DN860_c0_g1_i6.p1  ORF type:complete len:1560 (+),score=397.22 TRINITY_DN860_c0_g1_i6:285-4964(+)